MTSQTPTQDASNILTQSATQPQTKDEELEQLEETVCMDRRVVAPLPAGSQLMHMSERVDDIEEHNDHPDESLACPSQPEVSPLPSSGSERNTTRDDSPLPVATATSKPSESAASTDTTSATGATPRALVPPSPVGDFSKEVDSSNQPTTPAIDVERDFEQWITLPTAAGTPCNTPTATAAPMICYPLSLSTGDVGFERTIGKCAPPPSPTAGAVPSSPPTTADQWDDFEREFGQWFNTSSGVSMIPYPGSHPPSGGGAGFRVERGFGQHWVDPPSDGDTDFEQEFGWQPVTAPTSADDAERDLEQLFNLPSSTLIPYAPVDNGGLVVVRNSGWWATTANATIPYYLPSDGSVNLPHSLPQGTPGTMFDSFLQRI